MLCLNCRYVSKPGSDFCHHCGASLGVRYCPKKHASPMEAEFCGVCGSSKLSKPARAVPISLVSRLIAWGVFAAAVLVALAHASEIGRALGSLLAHLLCWALHLVMCLFGRLIAFLVAVHVLSHMLPEAWGKRVRETVHWFLRLSWKAVIFGLAAALACGRLLVRLVNGRKALPEKGQG